MTEALISKELASAAAQGVAIALNARKLKPAGVKEDLFVPPHLICGIPPFLFAVKMVADPEGNIAPGTLTQHQTER